MKISAFVLTTNSIKNQFPFIESITSFLPVVDELIIIDGGSTDGTIEAIQNIDSNKIRIIQDNDTKWEDNWTYWRMGHNFNRGLKECTGDWIIKFDADYILHEKGTTRFRNECKDALKNKRFSIAFTRLNFICGDRYYIKSKKTLGINANLCRELGIDCRYGLDLENWGFGFEFIEFKEYKHNINFGRMIRKQKSGNSFVSSLVVFNYDYCFVDKETVKRLRRRHWLAEERQRAIIDNYKFNEVDNSWSKYKKMCESNLNKSQYKIKLDDHPYIIRNKIKQLTPEKQGFNCWGWYEDIIKRNTIEDKSMRQKNINTPKYWNDFFRQDRFKRRHCWRIKPYKAIQKFFNISKVKNKKIVDLGCAFGDGLNYLHNINQDNEYIGIDYSDECIKHAKDKYNKIKFKVGDIYKYNEKSDIIIIAETLEHLDNDKKILKNLKRLCETLIITVPNDELSNRGKMHHVHVNNYKADDFKGAKVFEENNYLVIIYE